VPNDSAGTLIGFVRDAARGAPRGDGVLTVRGAELVLERSGLQRAVPEVKARTSAAGWFAVCDLPARYGPTVRIEDHWGNYCRPAIIIDRVRMPPEPLSMGETMPLDLLVQPDDIGQLEVYARDTEVPTEYQSLPGAARS